MNRRDENGLWSYSRRSFCHICPFHYLDSELFIIINFRIWDLFGHVWFAISQMFGRQLLLDSCSVDIIMADELLEVSTASTSSHKKHKDKSPRSKHGDKVDKRLSSIPNFEAQTFGSEFSSGVEETQRELTVSDIVIRSNFADLSADEQAATIMERFNHNVERSAFTHNPALGRALERVDVSYFVLGHRNQNAELFDPRGQRYATVFTADPKQEVKSLGPVLKTEPYIKAFGKHVLNVPAGHYARAFSKNRCVPRRKKEFERTFAKTKKKLAEKVLFL